MITFRYNLEIKFSFIVHHIITMYSWLQYPMFHVYNNIYHGTLLIYCCPALTATTSLCFSFNKTSSFELYFLSKKLKHFKGENEIKTLLQNGKDRKTRLLLMINSCTFGNKLLTKIKVKVQT